MNIQYLSLVFSIFGIFISFILIFLSKNGKIFYCSMVVWFLSEIIYYISILLFLIPGHDYSIVLRIFQTVLLMAWVFFNLIDIVYEKYKIYKISRKIEKLKIMNKGLKNIIEKLEKAIK